MQIQKINGQAQKTNHQQSFGIYLKTTPEFNTKVVAKGADELVLEIFSEIKTTYPEFKHTVTIGTASLITDLGEAFGKIQQFYSGEPASVGKNLEHIVESTKEILGLQEHVEQLAQKHKINMSFTKGPKDTIDYLVQYVPALKKALTEFAEKLSKKTGKYTFELTIPPKESTILGKLIDSKDGIASKRFDILETDIPFGKPIGLKKYQSKNKLSNAIQEIKAEQKELKQKNAEQKKLRQNLDNFTKNMKQFEETSAV